MEANEATEFLDKYQFIINLLVVLFLIFVTYIARKLNHKVFFRLQKDRKEIHLIFLEKFLANVILIVGAILVFSVFGGFDSLWKTVLGGTAIMSAVLAFVAQDAIKDVLAGLMISMYKPFELGNRIVLEDGTAGIVKDITMRHVVLQGIDSLVFIVPNSKLNGMYIKNFSYHSKFRSILFDFHIAYGSDVELAKKLIMQIVTDSDSTVPGKKTSSGMTYADVYFMAFEDSSYRLSTTVYYPSVVPTEKITSEINFKVNKAFEENGIEIPFKYINVIQKG